MSRHGLSHGLAPFPRNRMKNPYKSGLQFSDLPAEVLEEFLARRPWSVFHLPDWCRLQKPMKPLHVRIIMARRKAKKRAEAAA